MSEAEDKSCDWQQKGLNYLIYELRHEISNYVVCATSQASDQPAHTRSLISDFASGLNII